MFKLLFIMLMFAQMISGTGHRTLGVSTCMVNDGFTGTSGTNLTNPPWTQTTAAGYDQEQYNSGSPNFADTNTSNTGMATYTGTSPCTPTGDSALVVVSFGADNSGPCVRLSTAGSGYCWVLGAGDVIIFLAGAQTTAIITDCPIPSAGDTVKITASGTTIGCTDITTGGFGTSVTNSVYPTGKPGIYTGGFKTVGAPFTTIN